MLFSPSKDEKEIHLNWQPDTHTSRAAVQQPAAPDVSQTKERKKKKETLWLFFFNNRLVIYEYIYKVKNIIASTHTGV
jgi:hypothetical protein